jgi:hypothetical protein
MPRLTDIWTLIEVDPRGLLTLLALAVAALALGRLLAGGLRALPVHDWTERGLVWVLVGGIAFSWTGTFLATLGLFRWWAVLLGLIVIVLLARRTLRGDRAGEISAAPLPPTPRLAVWAVLVLLAVALWTFARPAESFFLVDDSAVYTLGGIVLAREGDLMSRSRHSGPQRLSSRDPFTSTTSPAPSVASTGRFISISWLHARVRNRFPAAAEDLVCTGDMAARSGTGNLEHSALRGLGSRYALWPYQARR